MRKVLPGLIACSGSIGLVSLGLTAIPVYAQQGTQSAQSLPTSGNMPTSGNIKRPFVTRPSATGPGTLTTASIITGIEWNDNYNLDTTSPGDVLMWDTVLQAGMERRTLTDTFLADAEGTIRFSDEPLDGQQAQADNPIVSLAYDRTVDDSSMTFGARYQRADLDFFDPLSDIDPNGNFANSFGGGSRESIRANVGLDLNSNGPVSLNVIATAFAVNYYDTTDPTLNDQVNNTALADLGFELTPTLQMLVGAGYNLQTFSNATDTEIQTTSADIGFVAQLNERVDSTLRLGYSEVQTDRTTGDTTQEGIVGSLNVVAQQQNGQIGADVNSTVNQNGEQYNATVFKQIQWTNATLDFRVGATQSQNTEIRPIGNIAYTYDMPRTVLGFGLRQFATVDDNGNDTLNTYLNASVTHNITPVSAVSLILGAGAVRYENDLQNDYNRANFTAVYSHSLTSDWDLNFGYRGRLRDTENTQNAESNAVFVGLQRDFASIR